MEKKWYSLESGEKVPLLKTAFSITVRGIMKSILDESFDDDQLLDKVIAADLSALDELAVSS